MEKKTREIGGLEFEIKEVNEQRGMLANMRR